MENSIAAVKERLLDPSSRISAAPGARFVYMLFLNDEVVYVGFTSQLGQRIGAHKSGVTGIEFDAYSFVAFTDHAEAINAERALIEQLRPRFNKSMPQREYTGTPESNKEKRKMEFAAQQERRATSMKRQEEKSAAWWAKLPQFEKDRIREQTVSYNLHCNPHLSREEVEQDFDRRNAVGE
jgi:predicted GIY-YIG superfamily endonuclease